VLAIDTRRGATDTHFGSKGTIHAETRLAGKLLEGRVGAVIVGLRAPSASFSEACEIKE